MAVFMHTVVLADFWHLAREPDGKITRAVDDLGSAMATFAQRLENISVRAALPSDQIVGRIDQLRDSIRWNLRQFKAYLEAMEDFKEAITRFADAAGALVVANERKWGVRYASSNHG